jgi:hypothetical protein
MATIPQLSLPEILLTALRERFTGRGMREGTPPEPLVVFPAPHPELGELQISVESNAQGTLGGVLMVSVTIDRILADHFNSLDTHLDDTTRAARVTKDVVRFLDFLFADRLLIWVSADTPWRGGWRERIDASDPEPLVLDDRLYRRYLWSGPLPLWQATPAILARGCVRDERDYHILRGRIQESGPDDLHGHEREQAARLIDEYERAHPGEAEP